jgi:hypothetical protein
MYMSDERSARELNETEIYSYFDVFLPGWKDPATTKSDLAATIDIISLGIWEFREKRLASVFREGEGLTPLLKLLADAPKVQFIPGGAAGRAYFVTFRCRERWAELFRESAIHTVLYGIYPDAMGTYDCSEYNIVLNKSFAVPWMKYREHDARAVDHEGAVAFVEGLGFTQKGCLGNWSVFVDVQGDGDDWESNRYKVFSGRRKPASRA